MSKSTACDKELETFYFRLKINYCNEEALQKTNAVSGFIDKHRLRVTDIPSMLRAPPAPEAVFWMDTNNFEIFPYGEQSKEIGVTLTYMTVYNIKIEAHCPQIFEG